jgi:predicted molibdopterin-dependent oxidoreductase YjgC
MQTACTLPAAAGLKVSSESPQVMEVRRLLVKLLLAEGEHDCLTCEATGRLLQQCHTGTMTRKSAGLDNPAGPRVMISAEDADELGISNGEAAGRMQPGE